jgi:Ca-activated chloride channel homolog
MGEEDFHRARQRFERCRGSNPKVGEALMPRCRRGPWSFVIASLFTIFAWALLLIALSVTTFQPEAVFAASPGQSAGSLGIIGKGGSIKGDCPLKHTEVRGAISGSLARITVTQIFENIAPNAIEAVYTFPLPQDAAVDDMTIQVGGRTIRSVIKRREEARAIYEKANATGHTAALLDQERPNIFSQAVANIMSGEQVSVTISYAETLQYQDGGYEFVFPMVVGPRYIRGWAPDTDKVPDASRITPNVAAVPGTRAGHDISLELAIDAGVPIQELRSPSHQIDVERTAMGFAKVKLQNEGEIPNKDFVLKYSVAGEQISDAVLSHWVPQGSADDGYFTLILQPPTRVPESDITPKELVFVLDTSGSMSGFPIEKGKELISRALDELYPGDTFNVITFSGDTQILFPEPVFPTAENIRMAKNLLSGRHGGGGTEMMKAIRAALQPSDSQDHLRVVCFVTDGYVGNDMEIIGEVQKHPNARVFAFGIGNSVNRFLIEGMAKAGRGDSEVVMLNDKADEAAHRLYERLRSPLLTDLSLDWRGLPVSDIYPQRLPDLFDGKPLCVTGRYTAPIKGSIRLRGKRAGEDFVRDIPVALASGGNQNDVLAGFWARRRIDDLMSQDWAGIQAGNTKPEVQKEITQLGLDYRLMTQFTSFVAVEDRIVTKDGKPQRVEVPAEMPEGVSYEGVFGGEAKQFDRLTQFSQLRVVNGMVGVTKSGRGRGAGSGSGVGAGSAGGMGGTVAMPTMAQNATPPPPSPIASATVTGDSSDAPSKLTPERKALESKLHPSLLEAFDCVAKKQQECKLVHDGKVEIQIWLTANSASVLDALRKAGFEPTAGQLAEKTLVGKIAVEKLQPLTLVSEVRFVSQGRK